MRKIKKSIFIRPVKIRRKPLSKWTVRLALAQELFKLYFQGMHQVNRADKQSFVDHNICFNIALDVFWGKGCSDRRDKIIEAHDKIMRQVQKEKQQQINEGDSQTAAK